MEFSAWIVYKKDDNGNRHYLVANASIVKGKIEFLDLWQDTCTIECLIKTPQLSLSLQAAALEACPDTKRIFSRGGRFIVNL